MVQQFTREGNMRSRRRKASPMGDLYMDRGGLKVPCSY